MATRDPITSADYTASVDHSYIHQGKAFSLPVTITGLAAAGVSNIGFTTPAKSVDGKTIHWRPTSFSSTANAVRVRLC